MTRRYSSRRSWDRPRVKSSIIRDVVDLEVLYPPYRPQSEEVPVGKFLESEDGLNRSREGCNEVV